MESKPRRKQQLRDPIINYALLVKGKNPFDCCSPPTPTHTITQLPAASLTDCKAEWVTRRCINMQTALSQAGEDEEKGSRIQSSQLKPSGPWWPCGNPEHLPISTVMSLHWLWVWEMCMCIAAVCRFPEKSHTYKGGWITTGSNKYVLLYCSAVYSYISWHAQEFYVYSRNDMALWTLINVLRPIVTHTDTCIILTFIFPLLIIPTHFSCAFLSPSLHVFK